MGKWKKPLGKERRWNKKALIRRDGTNCAICGEPMMTMDDITIDHLVPLSRGGLDVLDNLRLAHAKCNEKRGNSLEGEERCPTEKL